MSAEITEADRRAAFRVVRDMGLVPLGHDMRPAAEIVAAALAAEREKAREPFLALAQELASVACDHSATVAGDAYADAADRILAILEGTYA